MFSNKTYSLYKCKKILRQVYSLYKRKKKNLTEIQKKRFENILNSLQASIFKKNKKAAEAAAKNLENLTILHLKKTPFEKFFDITVSLIFAIIVAFVLIRQMWFELYTIPTGSMRPTLKEKDFVIVSKTDYSINVPFMNKHFYFDPNLLNRGSIVVLSSANLDLPDTNMLYFYVFPGKKQFVKRLIGKPGDILYFYGGKIYGIDKNGNEIEELWKSPWIKQIEHIPFIRFEGRALSAGNNSQGNSSMVFYQMNEPIALLNINALSQIEGSIITGHSSAFTKDSQIKNYFDIWGISNYAMSRILSKEEVENFSLASLDGVENAPLYLELTHHPSLKNAKIIRDEMGRLRPGLSYERSLIALNEDSLKKIFNSIYTARFVVKNGYIYRYGSNFKDTKYLVKIDGVGDGCYEIQDGKAYRVNFLGIITKLKEDHPLNTFSIEKTKTFYNLGIEFITLLNPGKNNQ
ncbi:MAG: signal peptidase I, partial [Parachlamydiales bacterium]